jgi:hypothetical protein
MEVSDAATVAVHVRMHLSMATRPLQSVGTMLRNLYRCTITHGKGIVAACSNCRLQLELEFARYRLIIDKSARRSKKLVTKEC